MTWTPTWRPPSRYNPTAVPPHPAESLHNSCGPLHAAAHEYHSPLRWHDADAEAATTAASSMASVPGDRERWSASGDRRLPDGTARVRSRRLAEPRAR